MNLACNEEVRTSKKCWGLGVYINWEISLRYFHGHIQPMGVHENVGFDPENGNAYWRIVINRQNAKKKKQQQQS